VGAAPSVGGTSSWRDRDKAAGGASRPTAMMGAPPPSATGGASGAGGRETRGWGE